MRQEIKERVEKIRRGEVPEGYKKTKVGIIPEEWKVIKLKEIGRFSKGKGISKSDVINCGKGCVRYGEIYTSHHVFIKNFKSFISEEDASNSKLISKGDILFAGSGETAEEIGKAVCYMMDDEAYAGGDIIILSPKNKNNYFYGYVLNHNLVNKQTRIKGQGQSIVHIYSKDLESIRIPNPSNYEENKIAEIFYTWDKAIELKEKLIEVKIESKKGFMQKLLTGKIRFPEFTDEWEEKKIIDILNYEQPNKYITENIVDKDETLTPVLTANKSFILGSTFDKNGIYTETPVIIFDDFTIDNKYIDFPFKIRSSAIKILKTKNDNVDIKFVYELMQFIKFPLGEHKRYYISEFQSVKIKIPKHIEQVKIVEVSNLLDSELNLFNTELNHLKEQKRGLMQLLLTGIVRVEAD